ncbi:serine/threonine-protein kinase 10-like [Leptidea sinapis]|uniref:serine/threonine-protein kinase 10-like n=1 Tax=Leptidea sinapis TaxID=189913 RepID=UPI00213C7373|nr:serine/threonine-protein kinase 10-like [Leptidea sinapis]
MEDVLAQRVTPILKCMVLFLFIFTAKVFTSRPQDSDYKNSIHQHKPSYYVRTFTKYHHRRTIQWNSIHDSGYWPEHPTVKRSVNYERIKRSNLIGTANNIYQLHSDSVKLNTIDGSTSKEGADVVKEVEPKSSSTTSLPIKQNKTCLYKIHSVTMSVTPDYADDKKADMVVENEIFGRGTLSETTLADGEVVQVEQCTDPQASCYTLFQQGSDANVTVLGQGCWRFPHSDARNDCDKCTRVTARLPGTKFCCCTKSFCNADFTSLREETVTIKAESTMESASTEPNYSSVAAAAILALVAILLMAIVFRKVYCTRALYKDEVSDGVDLEKGDIMGSGPDALATGLLCVDNLTLIEHIGQGKFGSVWRGSLGSTPVAVKLYNNPNAWQKEVSIYGIPHLSHPNILRYYGSDTRPSLIEDGRSHLLVVELCPTTLRSRLQRAPVTWLEFATIAHGLASAIAHLHTPSGNKPCIVHRDVNSGNVLVAGDGTARLADLGLAQPLSKAHLAGPSRITEAGTLRYLSPEALEGALDLSGARAALCAVDVYALGLVLWETLWRCSGAHRRTPEYEQPYHEHSPTLTNMQALVCRSKMRPPLPKGPVPEARALKIATDTCEECWDHDAEARLTAVCVEERMAELKLMLLVQGPVIHDNNLHPNQPDTNTTHDIDKNSNCLAQNGDVTAPLLYTHPHMGRNACIERNTNTHTHTVELIHKSLKDIAVVPEPKPQLECLSVARVTSHRFQNQENSDRMNEIRSYQRPLDYVQNDVSDCERAPKQTNLNHEQKDKWGLRKFLERRLNRTKETEVKLVNDVTNNGRIRTSVIEKAVSFDRPSNLNIQERPYYETTSTMSPPNRTLSPNMLIESEMNTAFRELPSDERNQVFAVIVPKVIDLNQNKTNSSDSLNKKSIRTSLSSQSIKAGQSESEDSTLKKRLSCDNRILTNSAGSSRASINLELQYLPNQTVNYNIDSPFDVNSDCSSSEDEHLMLLSENGGAKITMHTISKDEKQNEVLKESSQTTDRFNRFQNKYTNFDNEFSDPHDKENLVNGYSGDNPVYIATINGEIDSAELKIVANETNENGDSSRSPKPRLKNLTIKRQHSLEQVSDIFSSSSDISLQNPAGRVKTPGDLPVAVRRARRDRALQKGRASECNRLSLYDDRMMFGNSL